jgi:transcriptional regulator with XRE-family HTH domain
MEIHEYIKKLRIEKGFTQNDLGEKLALTPTAYRKIELGETELTVLRVRQLARIFEVSEIDILYCGEGVPMQKDEKVEMELLQSKVGELQEKLNRLQRLELGMNQTIVDASNDIGIVYILLRQLEDANETNALDFITKYYPNAIDEQIEKFVKNAKDEHKEAYREKLKKEKEWMKKITLREYLWVRLGVYERLSDSFINERNKHQND